jgi:predicted transport protein
MDHSCPTYYTILIDVGVFPDGTQGPLVYSYGLCSWNNLPKSLYDSCMSQTLTLQDINMEFQQTYSNIPFGFIQSKADIVQQSFYVAIAVSMNVSAVITPEQFYADLNEIFGAYNKGNKNFVTYLVDGPQHCFTPLDVVYTADGLGPLDDNSTDNTGIMMNNWLAQYPLEKGESVDTLCLGDLDSQSQSPSKIMGDTDYCSSDVSPKEFTES